MVAADWSEVAAGCQEVAVASVPVLKMAVHSEVVVVKTVAASGPMQQASVPVSVKLPSSLCPA